MPSPTDRSSSPRIGWWRCRALAPDGNALWMALVSSSLHPDGHHVDMSEDEATELVLPYAVCTAHYEDGSIASLVSGPGNLTSSPPVWFGEVDEPTATPPASNLVAFVGHGVRPGALLDHDALADVGVGSSDQVGAVRWYPATGEVDQIYVAPRSRRQGVGNILVVAGSILNQARGLPRWWGDGQRTADGDRWRKASPWGHRAADLTHLAPPMTPPEQR